MSHNGEGLISKAASSGISAQKELTEVTLIPLRPEWLDKCDLCLRPC
ncbi:hypothetical protein [Thalassolituus sp.]